MNKNGVGYACDEAEQELFKRWATMRVTSVIPAEIPLPVPECIQCGSYLPQGFEEVVNITLPIGFAARIVDSNSVTVAKSTGAATTHALRFEPNTFAQNVATGGRSVIPAAQEQADAPPLDGLRYRLHLYPVAGTVPDQSYEMRIDVSYNQQPPTPTSTPSPTAVSTPTVISPTTTTPTASPTVPATTDTQVFLPFVRR